MKNNSLPDGNSSKPILVPALVAAAVILAIAQFSGMANSQDVQIISASPGQTITYQGHGSPNSQVTIEVSANISANVSNNHYISKMNGVNIPGGSRFSITARPVDTLTVSGSPSWAGGLGYSLQGSVSNGVGSASMGNVPGGAYNILVSGIANSSGPVSITVHAYQSQSVGGDGTFMASISTSGLPSAVYSVKQDGTEVAKVYLGVQAPATPTPTAAPTATPTATATPNGTTAQTSGTSVTPTTNASITPTSNIPVSPTPGIWISPTAQPGEASAGGNNSLLIMIAIMIGAVIAGLVIGYIVVFVILKK